MLSKANVFFIISFATVCREQRYCAKIQTTYTYSTTQFQIFLVASVCLNLSVFMQSNINRSLKLTKAKSTRIYKHLIMVTCDVISICKLKTNHLQQCCDVMK